MCTCIRIHIHTMSHLLLYHTPDTLEVGVDEAGRGPLFGRVYAGAVYWPKDLQSPLIKDSKKYTKESEREKAFDFIIEHALAWGIAYVEPEEIDKIGIQKAVMRAMHGAIRDTCINPDHILVDGDRFEPFLDNDDEYPKYNTVVAGDNTYYSIAAGSVLAKVSHDRYIADLCDKYPCLDRYELRGNKGYGSARHIEAIRKYGITQFHRQSFSKCNNMPKTRVQAGET
jgi:ribonuclease HII